MKMHWFKKMKNAIHKLQNILFRTWKGPFENWESSLKVDKSSFKNGKDYKGSLKKGRMH